MQQLKEILKTKGIKAMAKQCEEKLIANGYIYNEIFGWEHMSIIEKFKLDPNMRGVPSSLQPKWVLTKDGKDEYGNKIKSEEQDNWVRSDTLKAKYPNDNWLDYMDYKKQQNSQLMAKELIPLPELNQ